MSAVRIVLVKLTLNSGVWRWSTDRYFGEGQWWAPWLASGVTFSRRAGLALWSSSTPLTNLGAIEVLNTDNRYDDLINYSVDGGIVETWVITDEDEEPNEDNLVARDAVSSIDAVGESAIRIVRTSTLDRLASIPYADGVHAAGIDSIAGTPLPAALGRPFSCPIVLVDGIDYVYRFNDVTDADVTIVRDKGFPLSASGPTQYIVTGATLELQQLPVGTIVADVRARNSVPPGTHNVINCVDALMTRAGVTTSEYDGDSWDAVSALVTGGVSYWAGSGESCRQIIQEIADSTLAFVYTDRRGRIAAQPFVVPADLTPVLTLDDRNVIGEISPERDLAPGLATTVAAGRNWYVYDPGELADGLTPADRAMLSAEFRARAPVGGIAAELGAETIRGGRGGTTTRAVTTSRVGYATLLDGATAAGEIAARLAALYADGTAARIIKLTAQLDVLDAARLNPGDGVLLNLGRYGLVNRPGIVLDVDGDAATEEVSLRIWTQVIAANEAVDDDDEVAVDDDDIPAIED